MLLNYTLEAVVTSYFWTCCCSHSLAQTVWEH